MIIKLREKEKSIEKEVICLYSEIYEKNDNNSTSIELHKNYLPDSNSRFNDEDLEKADEVLQRIENREKAIQEVSRIKI